MPIRLHSPGLTWADRVISASHHDTQTCGCAGERRSNSSFQASKATAVAEAAVASAQVDCTADAAPPAEAGSVRPLLQARPPEGAGGASSGQKGCNSSTALPDAAPTMAQAMSAWKARQDRNPSDSGGGNNTPSTETDTRGAPDEAVPTSSTSHPEALTEEPDRAAASEAGSVPAGSTEASNGQASRGKGLPPALPVDISNEVSSLDRVELYRSRCVPPHRLRNVWLGGWVCV